MLAHTQNTHPNQKSCLLREDFNCSHQYYSRGITTEVKKLPGHRIGVRYEMYAVVYIQREGSSKAHNL